MKTTVLPADTYIVINKTLLNERDRNLLIMLYQPLIGSMAISLYLTLWSYLDKSELMSNENIFHVEGPIQAGFPFHLFRQLCFSEIYYR